MRRAKFLGEKGPDDSRPHDPSITDKQPMSMEQVFGATASQRLEAV
jgi:hypothetical protein